MYCLEGNVTRQRQALWSCEFIRGGQRQHGGQAADVLLLCERKPDMQHVLGAGEYGEAAVRAVELQRSSEEDTASTALRVQTEQGTSSLLQACSCLCCNGRLSGLTILWLCATILLQSHDLSLEMQELSGLSKLTVCLLSKGSLSPWSASVFYVWVCQTRRLTFMHAGLDREGNLLNPGQPGRHQRVRSSRCTQSVDGAHHPA